MSYVHVGRRPSLDLALLWQWCRPVATAPIQPLAWEPSNAVGLALKIHTHTHKVLKIDHFLIILLDFTITYTIFATSIISMIKILYGHGGSIHTMQINKNYQSWLLSH